MSWDAARKARHPFKTMQRRAMEFLRKKCAWAPNGCLEYQGKITSRSGHLQYVFRKRHWPAHRFVYAMLVADPGDLHVLHTCDNPKCMNIDHLWLGTQRDNSLDMVRKGRQKYMKKTTCVRGHPYDDQNTLRYGARKWRNCKICTRARSRIKAGWPEDLAYSMDTVPHGYAPVGAAWHT